MTRNRLYLFLFLALLAGYAYLGISYKNIHNPAYTPCLFKNATGIACPSCGATRSVLLLAHGSIQSAILLNPFGILIALIMLIVPFLLCYDVFFKKNILYNSYKKTEAILKFKWVAIPLIALAIANWGWNIYKGL